MNPKPQFASDVVLAGRRLAEFVDGVLRKNEGDFDVSPSVVYSYGRYLLETDLKSDAFLTPLLHAYNRAERNTRIVIGGFPSVIGRDLAVRNSSFEQIVELFHATCNHYENSNLNFDAEQLLVAEYWNQKSDYMAELLRQTCASAKRVLLVTKSSAVPSIEEAWRGLPR